LVVGRRIDRQAVMATVIDEVRRERPDRVGTEAPTLGGGCEEEVDTRVSEVRFGLLGGLDVADADAVDEDREALLVRMTAGQVRLDTCEAERAPPACDRWLGEDRGQRRRVASLDRP